MATGNPVVDAILAATQNVEIREAMLLGSDLESSWNPDAVGDQGTSFGPFQMHEGGALTSSGLTPMEAEDPVIATKAMLGAYTAAVNQIPQSLWQSSPEQAAEQAAVGAERPAEPYFVSDGIATVNAKWTEVMNALAGKVSQQGAPTNATTTSILTNPVGDILGGIANDIGVPNIADLFQRLGLILLGAFFILLGIFLLVGKDAAKVAVSFVPGAEQVASNYQALSDKGKNLGKSGSGKSGTNSTTGKTPSKAKSNTAENTSNAGKVTAAETAEIAAV